MFARSYLSNTIIILHIIWNNKMIKRELESKLLTIAKQFPVIAITGPRQSGKTTLAKSVFADYRYISLENLDTRAYATNDPRNFLTSFDNATGVIIDEIQEVPHLFSYLQEIVDTKKRPGFFVLTGSQNILLQENISQSLAGRIAIFTLLPLSINELKLSDLLPKNVDEVMLKGFYPRIYSEQLDIQTWINNYINTYLERDVRQLININNLLTFQRFIKVCAARIGNILNYADLARDCDISLNTAKSWLSILEASYIIKLVQPYYKNFNKRITQTPKIYFYDTGIACALLGIKRTDELNIHPMRGHLFENMIIADTYKYNFNNNIIPNIYFWRDVQGHEIDCLIEKSFDKLVPIEIKSSMTISDRFFKTIIDWKKIIKETAIDSYLVYGGNENWIRREGQIFSWESVYEMLEKIYKC